MFEQLTKAIKSSKYPLIVFVIASAVMMAFEPNFSGQRIVTEDDLMNASAQSVIMSYIRGALFVGCLFVAIKQILASYNMKVKTFKIIGAGIKSFTCGMLGALMVLYVFSVFVSIDDIVKISEQGMSMQALAFALVCALMMVFLLYGGTSVSLAQYLYNGYLNTLHSGQKKSMKEAPGYVNGFKVFPLMFFKVFKSWPAYVFILAYGLLAYAAIHAGYREWYIIQSALSSLSMTSLMLMFIVTTHGKLSESTAYSNLETPLHE